MDTRSSSDPVRRRVRLLTRLSLLPQDDQAGRAVIAELAKDEQVEPFL